MIPEIDQAITDLQTICNSTDDETITEVANHAADLLGMLGELLPKTLNKRRCRDCGLTAYHAGNVTPYVLCGRCGSQDTRLVRAPVSVSAG